MMLVGLKFSAASPTRAEQEAAALAKRHRKAAAKKHRFTRCHCAFCGTPPSLSTNHYYSVRRRLNAASGSLSAIRHEAELLLKHPLTAAPDPKFLDSMTQIITGINRVKAKDTPKRKGSFGGQFWRAVKRRLNTDEHIFPKTLFFKQMKALPRAWTVLPACVHCNSKKGWYPFPAHIKGIRGVLSEPFTDRNGEVRRYFQALGPGRDIDRPRIVANVAAYFRHRFAEIQSLTHFSKKSEVERILGNIACMALTGSKHEVFPPPPRKLNNLFDLLRQSPDFNALLQERDFLALISQEKIDERLKPVAKAIQDYSRTHRLRVLDKTA